MSRRSGLGRGLAALIPPSPPASAPVEEETDDRTAPTSAAVDQDHGETPGTHGEDGEPTDRTEGGTEPTGPGTAAAADGSSVPDGDLDPAAPDGGAGTDHPAPDEVASPADRAPREGDADPPDPLDAVRSVPPRDGPAAEPGATPDPAGLVTPSAATLAELDPHTIVPNPQQPREVFDPEEIEGLAVSLADIGVLQPLVVRPRDDGRYELVAGERRLRAAKLAGLERIPAVVRHTDDTAMLKEALVENIHRVQLNPLEEAAAYQQLLEEFGVTQDELAASLGRSRPAISNAIRLLQLPTDVQRRVAAGVLSAGHAKALLAIEDPTSQAKLADRIVAEGLSVRATEELIRLRLLDDDRDRSGTGRRRAPTAPGLVELQEDLSDALEARVRISMGARRGKLAIEFASVDDLERIVGVIANGLGGPGGSGAGLVPPAPADPAAAQDHGVLDPAATDPGAPHDPPAPSGDTDDEPS